MKINEVIVVEGKHDSERLKKYFDVDTIETNGLGLTDKKIELIRNINEKRGVILFLDPDIPGNKIRNRLNEAIPNLKNAFIDKKLCRTTKKVGIEHASKEALMDSLNNIVTYNNCNNTLSFSDYLDLGFQGKSDSKHKRAVIGNLLFLGECNSKTLFKRLNMYQITKEELERLIEEEYD